MGTYSNLMADIQENKWPALTTLHITMAKNVNGIESIIIQKESGESGQMNGKMYYGIVQVVSEYVE